MNKKFKRQEYARYKKLGVKWRKPRGKSSKMRRYEAGKAAMPSIGYGSNKLTRNLHPSGFKDVIVHNLNDLEKLDRDSEVARISASVGNKKKLAIVEKANELGIKVLNKKVYPKNPKSIISESLDELSLLNESSDEFEEENDDVIEEEENDDVIEEEEKEENDDVIEEEEKEENDDVIEEENDDVK
jgi:large subunit ribosomal protein L32e